MNGLGLPNVMIHERTIKIAADDVLQQTTATIDQRFLTR